MQYIEERKGYKKKFMANVNRIRKLPLLLLDFYSGDFSRICGTIHTKCTSLRAISLVLIPEKNQTSIFIKIINEKQMGVIFDLGVGVMTPEIFKQQPSDSQEFNWNPCQCISSCEARAWNQHAEMKSNQQNNQCYMYTI